MNTIINKQQGQVIVFVLSSEDEAVPKKVNQVTIAKMRAVPDKALYRCQQLVQAELAEGIEQIGDAAFSWCSALTNVSVPPTVNIIGTWAFAYCSSLQFLDLAYGLKEIGDQALRGCKSLKKLVVPSTCARIGKEALAHCPELTSVELAEGLREIGDNAFVGCCNLKNVALPTTLSKIGKDAFHKWMLRFRRMSREATDTRLLDALKGRFIELPIHNICYFQAHHLTDTTEVRLQQAIQKNHFTGFEADEFGMTPLHILAISAKPNIRLFRLMLKEYPENLVVKDRWGNFPVHYACDSYAPTEIIQLLLDKHTCVATKASMDWKRLMMLSYENCSEEATRCVVRSSIADRMSFLGLQLWKDDIHSIVNEISEGISFVEFRRITERIQSTLESYELKEKLSQLELALWEAQLQRDSPVLKRDANHRSDCRIVCGVAIVVPYVLSFLGDELRMGSRRED
ncbi:unnamed protein product [Cylindrotheca closterium]|uniref:Uncharacterized protein n=1 Tax=Cylindrotheca closterium TaxID=2856 RepID=A0AAD2FHW1_9STRA|nr:unnamed protein product [Cylindrotheca closterium]